MSPIVVYKLDHSLDPVTPKPIFWGASISEPNDLLFWVELLDKGKQKEHLLGKIHCWPGFHAPGPCQPTVHIGSTGL